MKVFVVHELTSEKGKQFEKVNEREVWETDEECGQTIKQVAGYNSIDATTTITMSTSEDSFIVE